MRATRNVNDSNIQFCFEEAERNGDTDGMVVARKLLAMTKTQRLKICYQAFAKPQAAEKAVEDMTVGELGAEIKRLRALVAGK